MPAAPTFFAVQSYTTNTFPETGVKPPTFCGEELTAFAGRYRIRSSPREDILIGTHQLPYVALFIKGHTEGGL
ncbi:MAG: hypothetical protein MUO26_00240 [Methanotrichaceae archaeon]|nr:hypothetical protein [Methanotrichaceae archaeon]